MVFMCILCMTKRCNACGFEEKTTKPRKIIIGDETTGHVEDLSNTICDGCYSELMG